MKKKLGPTIFLVIGFLAIDFVVTVEESAFMVASMILFLQMFITWIIYRLTNTPPRQYISQLRKVK